MDRLDAENADTDNVEYDTNNEVFLMKSQQGMALVIALLILVLVSLLGITAMRSSIMATRVATSAQAEGLAFEAAETAIEQSMRVLNLMSPGLFDAAMSDGMRSCVTRSELFKVGACGNNDTFDARGAVRAEALGRYVRDNTGAVSGRPLPGFQISSGPSGVPLRQLEIELIGAGRVPAMNAIHLQAWDMSRLGYVFDEF